MPFISRIHIALGALLLGVLFAAVGWLLSGDSMTGKVLFDVGGAFGFFSIQNFMWLAFFVGLGELLYRHQHLGNYEQALRQHYLPDDPQILLTPADMPPLYRSMAGRHGELENMIRNLVIRFQAGRSVEQTHEMLNSQLDLWQYRLDIDYSMIRYLSWLIPTLGFLGTVVGIAIALNTAGSMGQDQMDKLLTAMTNDLGVAFYTTMLALAMSAIIVFIMHIVQGWEERAISRSGQYCLDNLITKLYLAPDGQNH
jgi:biopolymer transport protein ExbB/TolQ